MIKHLCMVSNTAWSMWNFRRGLLSALLQHGYRITIVAPPDNTVFLLCDLGCSFIPLSLSPKGVNPAVELKLIFDFVKIYRRINADLIIHYTVKPNVYGSFAAHLCRVPTLAITTGLGYAFMNDGWVPKVVALLYKFAFRYPRLVIFLNEDDRIEFISRQLVDEKKTLLLPGEGIDLNFFSPAGKSAEDGSVSFLLIARLLWDKGVGEYVAAAKQIRISHPNVKFKLLGDFQVNNPRAIGYAQLNEWINEGVLEYIGTTHDVRPIIMESDCVVLPSYREGLPRTMIEAAAMAKPIIVTDVPGCRDVLLHEKTGLLCQARNVSSLTYAMMKFIRMTKFQRTLMGNAGRQLVSARFDEKKVISIYFNILEQHIGGAHPSD
ncbi:glycosyltransferase family 4 protein [Aeromonas hydrophila]|uniref:glycosyltransferase family 4 protein n=1 Tax=Aeromonas hydrophila TaxID=644 RepID=UPI002F417A88